MKTLENRQGNGMNRPAAPDYSSPEFNEVSVNCENGFCNSLEHQSFGESNYSFDWE